VSDLCAVNIELAERKEAYAYIQFKRRQNEQAQFRGKVDRGAEGNTIPIRMFRRIWPEKLNADGNPKEDCVNNKHVNLIAYNKTKIPHHGSIKIMCGYKESEWTKEEFFIVASEGPAIIGLPTSMALQLVTLHCDDTLGDTSTCIQTVEKLNTYPSQVTSVKELVQQYPDQFDQIGQFPGKYHIVLKEESHPVIHPPRKCSIHIREELKAELDDMEHQEVIQKVNEPTDWVNSIALSRRANGKLRICLDPKDLNKQIKRCHHHTPTVEELTHQFSGAQHFSKLDAKNGYWSVVLDDESSLLTTFNSPIWKVSLSSHALRTRNESRRISATYGSDFGTMSRSNGNS
jgi:hypothetical protein